MRLEADADTGGGCGPARDDSPAGVVVRRVPYPAIEAMRQPYRAEAGCQIVHDSALARGIADPYVILAGGDVVGYAGVWNRYYPGRLMELYVMPGARSRAATILGRVLRATGASHVEAQTNMPAMHAMFRACARSPVTEKLLFDDAAVSGLAVPGARVRPARPEDGRSGSGWVLEVEGRVVAAGGILDHYNPPYGDIFMEVDEPERRRGYGSYLVQELKRVCHERGMKPAARCNPDNVGSRRTLERAGFRICGRLVAGEVDPSRVAR